jgi:S-adenosylmethionine:tRNA ribosyltransferase-isomerase
MRVSDFDYELPEELIAQEPLAQREASRMMIIDRRAQRWHDSRFVELPMHFWEGDVIVLNDTRVFPARLGGERIPSGGRIELLLLKELEPNIWETLARPARRLKQATRLRFGDEELFGEVIECREDGRRVISFECEGRLMEIVDRIGQTPLPLYIKRDTSTENKDRERYQAVYAKNQGAIAAPTAGLHFTDNVLSRIKAAGARIVEVTLHVGYGTFEPVRVDDVSKHRVAPEHYSISDEAADAINQARLSGRRVIAVGTTTTRALETATDEQRVTESGPGTANLTIVPGYRFRAVDVLLTNFHLPRSSLLMLVSAFAGRELVLAAYRHAVKEKYRFYSYGDCMLII